MIESVGTVSGDAGLCLKKIVISRVSRQCEMEGNSFLECDNNKQEKSWLIYPFVWCQLSPLVRVPCNPINSRIIIGKQWEERADGEEGGLSKVGKRCEEGAEVKAGSGAGFILLVGLVDDLL
jgi:hypothetical protein